MMKCFKIRKSRGSAGFQFDDDFNAYDFELATDPTRVDGVHLEAYEYRQDIDGTPMPQHEVTEDLQSLVAVAEWAPRIRDYLSAHQAPIAEFTIESQFDTYTAFKPFGLHSDYPTAPMFRLLLSPEKPEMWHISYLSESFAQWINNNLPTDGLKLTPVCQDETFVHL